MFSWSKVMSARRCNGWVIALVGMFFFPLSSARADNPKSEHQKSEHQKSENAQTYKSNADKPKADTSKSEGSKTSKTTPRKTERVEKSLKRDRLPTFTAEREAAAVTFVRLHHPELAGLLNQLKSMQYEEYEKAIRELFHTSETLTELQNRDPQRHALALEAWQLQSRVGLVAARLRQSSDPLLEQEIKRLLEKQVEVQIREQELNRDRLEASLRRTETGIQRLKEDREKLVRNRLTQLTGRAKTPVRKEKNIKNTKSTDSTPKP